MTKTRVDDMLIEMIEPKIQEINEKFSNGRELTQDDINTLLLKSQYNHINHLDDKLNETVQSVANLEVKFEGLKKEYKSDFEGLKKDIEITIQKALNKNMMLLIVTMGAFLTLSKLIDKF
jgi:N-methylhydantoinase B/oxoprolinase/acetone carboxylase alpha subunit